RVELRLQGAVGPGDADDLGARGFAQPEVDHGTGNHLPLRVQPGSNLDLSANAERVDPLVARHSRRARAQDLPVVWLRALDAGAAGPAVGKPADEIEAAVALQVG